MALDTVHLPLHDGMVLRKGEFGVGGEVAVETRSGIASGIDDELPRTSRLDVFAAGPVAGFATALSTHRTGFGQMDARVRTGGEVADVIGVALETGAIANVGGTGNLQRDDDGAGQCGAGLSQCEQRESTKSGTGKDQRGFDSPDSRRPVGIRLAVHTKCFPRE